MADGPFWEAFGVRFGNPASVIDTILDRDKYVCAVVMLLIFALCEVPLCWLSFFLFVWIFLTRVTDSRGFGCMLLRDALVLILLFAAISLCLVQLSP